MELPEPHSCRYLTNDFPLHLSKNVIICKKRKDSPTAIGTIFKEYILNLCTQYKYILLRLNCQWRYIMELEEYVKERIKENEKLFSKEDLEIINSSIKVIKKIYLIGLVNGRNIYS